MRYFPNGAGAAFPSQATFAGRPFTLVDPAKNMGKAVVVLRGIGHDPAALLQATGIRIGARADTLWFLHTGCRVSAGSTDEVGRYIIHYADGSNAAFPIRSGIEIADWWSAIPPSAARVAWCGKNDVHVPVSVYVAEWSNPHREKQITTIDLVGGQTPAQIVLLGVTAGRVK
jgi:hypothetical protein